jgi:hypothetical protein
MLCLRMLAIVFIVALLFVVTPASAASNEPGFHITRMTIEPDGQDFNVTVHYSTSFITKIFSLLFGAKVVQPGIVDQLGVFGDVTLISIDTSGQTAKLQAINQTRLSGGYYFYNNGAEFPVAIDLLEIQGNSVDRPMMIKNALSVPEFFYRAYTMDTMNATDASE